MFADFAAIFAYPLFAYALGGCVWAKPTKRRTIAATLSNTLHYIDRTETSPPVSKLFGADTGGIKNPPYDSDYTGKSGAVKGKTSGTSSALDSTQLATAPPKENHQQTKE